MLLLLLYFGNLFGHKHFATLHLWTVRWLWLRRRRIKFGLLGVSEVGKVRIIAGHRYILNGGCFLFFLLFLYGRLLLRVQARIHYNKTFNFFLFRVSLQLVNVLVNVLHQVISCHPFFLWSLRVNSLHVKFVVILMHCHSCGKLIGSTVFGAEALVARRGNETHLASFLVPYVFNILLYVVYLCLHGLVVGRKDCLEALELLLIVIFLFGV